MKYKLMTPSNVKKYLSEATRLKVSEKSRTSGFIKRYLKDGPTMLHHMSDQPTLLWEDKRNSFISRTLASYNLHPTYRRWLSLIMWAYMPQLEYL